MTTEEQIKILQERVEKVRQEREAEIQRLMAAAGITQYIEDSKRILMAYQEAIQLLQPAEQPEEQPEEKPESS